MAKKLKASLKNLSIYVRCPTQRLFYPATNSQNIPRRVPTKTRVSTPQKTIAFSELKRLSMINSPKCPKKVVIAGTVREWVGIGWVDTEQKPTDLTIPVVIDG